MAKLSAPLVLASASPRRREILHTLGIEFRVVPSGADEGEMTEAGPDAFVRRAATVKALDVARRFENDEASPFVIGADTAVVVDARALGKPRDDEDCTEMLSSLSGRCHHVLTGVVLCRPRSGVLEEISVTTEVCFRSLSGGEIRRYVQSREGRDKAGGYAIQGLGSGLVASVAGSYHNVVGLPAAETLDLLRRHGVLSEWP